MILNPLEIGVRIRKIREEIYHESRLLFAERCGLSENHLGKLENGTILISVKALNKICTYAGADANYLLYGESKTKHLSTRRTIDNFLDNSTKRELKMYLKFISTLKSYYFDED